MSITSYITRNFQNSSNITTATSQPTNTTLLQIAESVAASSTVVVPLSYIAADVVAIYVWADSPGLTFTPNTGASAVLTMAASAGAPVGSLPIPYVYEVGDNSPSCAWSANFASQSVHNPGADTANFQIMVVSS